jgi:hypothetical protein
LLLVGHITFENTDNKTRNVWEIFIF